MINPDFYTTQHIELEVADLDIDEGLKDVILATLERYEEIKAKLAEIEKQEEPIKWQSTTEVYTPYITQSRYEKLRPEFQKWYRPYVAVQQSPAISKMETTSQVLAVPDLKEYSDDEESADFTNAYVNGWNDCIAETINKQGA